jgi:hypothetical protein
MRDWIPSARHKLAHGYFEEKDQFERWDYPMLTAGDGGFFSTFNDLFLWDQALNTERLVPKAALPLPPARPTTAHQLGMASAGSRKSFLTARPPSANNCSRSAPWSAPRRAWGQRRRLLQLHHPAFSIPSARSSS